MAAARVFLLALLLCSAGAVLAQDERAAERRQMVDEIERQSRLIAETRHTGLDARVLEAMRKVPRHEFVPPTQRRSAYRNRPLAIGSGQTISQPLIVALMTDLLHIKPGDSVLEVGTGSGYQAAVLSLLAKDVYTIEIVESLGKSAAKTLQRFGYANVHPKIGDGYKGWPEHAPFDSIIVTAAPDHIPPALIEQLKPGGRLVIPVGKFAQQLMVITKNADGSTKRQTIAPVQFVPLTREQPTK